MSCDSSLKRRQQLPPGTRLKGRWPQVLGVVVSSLGALVVLYRFSAVDDPSDGDPLPGGILLIAVGAGIWWWGRTRPTPGASAAAAQEAVPDATAQAEREADQEQEAAERAERDRREREAQRVEQERAEQEERLRHGYMSGTNWIPPRPRGAEVDPWGPARERVDLAGLGHRSEVLKLAARREGYRKGSEPVRFDVTITLVPDTHNPYGYGRAVAAYLNGEHTGYLAQEDADRFHHHLVALAEKGLVLRVPGRGRVGDWAEYLSVRLPDPYTIRPSNALPGEPHVVIPRGRTVQVAEEEQHMDVLAIYAPGSGGGENHVAVTLKTVNRIMPRSAYPAVAVLLDGQEVGVLTKGQSARLLPLVKHIEERGLLPVAHGVVKGTRLAVEVTLSTIMAADADDDWLDAMGPATGAANIDRR